MNYILIFSLILHCPFSLRGTENNIQEGVTPQRPSPTIKQQIWRYVSSKIMGLSCSYIVCGKNCTQAVQSFPEYVLAKTCCTYCSSPYYLGVVATTGGCILCCTEMYKTESCCFDKEWYKGILQPYALWYNH